jgi:hypothetical protein
VDDDNVGGTRVGVHAKVVLVVKQQNMMADAISMTTNMEKRV